MSILQIRCALDACDRRDSALALQMLEVVHAAVAPIAAGDKGMPAYERCVNWLMRVFRKPTESRARKDPSFATMVKDARALPLPPAEASFAAAARARLSGR